MTPSEPDDDITALLQDWRLGSAAAENALMARVHGELRRLAASYLRRERRGHTLQPTAVVHEAYLRLLPQRPVHWENRAPLLWHRRQDDAARAGRSCAAAACRKARRAVHRPADHFADPRARRPRSIRSTCSICTTP